MATNKRCAETLVVIPSRPPRPEEWRKRARASVLEGFADGSNGVSVRVLRDEEGLGPARLVAQAWEAYRGQFSFFGVLDDDDFLDPGSLHVLRTALRGQLKTPYAKARVVQVNEAGEETGDLALSRQAESLSNMRQGSFHGGFRLYRAEVLDAVRGYDATLPMAYDFDICFRVVREFGPGAVCLSAVCRKTKHADQISRNPKSQQDRRLLRAWIASRPPCPSTRLTPTLWAPSPKSPSITDPTPTTPSLPDQA